MALPGGRTRLEGRTWYTLRLYPTLYWTPVAEMILHRIHDRVLLHIKAHAERSPAANGPTANDEARSPVR